MKDNWSLHISLRYLLTHSGRKGHLGNALAVLGLIIGILTLITVLTVMNGFQQGFITSINEIYSYHIRYNDPGISFEEFREITAETPNIKAVVPFADYQAILTSDSGYTSGIQIRYIDETAALEDKGFLEQFQIVKGSFLFSQPGQILLGADLAREVNAIVGDTVTLAFMRVQQGKAALSNREFRVSGVFRTGYYEYDRNMAFTSLHLSGQGENNPNLVYGIKLKRHFRDTGSIRSLGNLLPEGKDKIVSWRTYNSAFFNALKIEKTFMLLIVGLIFIVVAVNIYHSMKRSVRERLEEMALLKAIGGTPSGVRRIFLLQGGIIGLSGCFLGTAAGVLISLNINAIMDAFVTFVQNMRLFLYQIGIGSSSGASLFYFTDIPVEIMAQDLIIINGAALVSVLAAAYGSVRTYSNIKPAEVFQSE